MIESERSVKTGRFEMYGGALIMYAGNLNWIYVLFAY